MNLIDNYDKETLVPIKNESQSMIKNWTEVADANICYQGDCDAKTKQNSRKVQEITRRTNKDQRAWS